MLRRVFGWGAAAVVGLAAAAALSCLLEIPLLSRGACLSVGLLIGAWIG